MLVCVLVIENGGRRNAEICAEFILLDFTSNRCYLSEDGVNKGAFESIQSTLPNKSKRWRHFIDFVILYVNYYKLLSFTFTFL